jgi:hypothetical protein
MLDLSVHFLLQLFVGNKICERCKKLTLQDFTLPVGNCLRHILN